MIPSANNSTGDFSAWHTDSWADHAGAAVATAFNSSVSSSSAAPAAESSRYLPLHRHQILDWENAMLLASHPSNAPSTTAAHDSVYDQVAAEYSKAIGISPMHADALASLSHPRHYEDLLSAHMVSSSDSASFSNNNAWGLLNTVCSRTSGSALQQEASLLQTAAGAQYTSYGGLNGGGLGGYGNQLATAAAAGLYEDSLRQSGSNNIGLTNFDQRRLDDIMKRELYTTHDFNSRLGLNLGGRTYFSADDFAFGRWGKRLRPNSPGCMMQPAPLCQAENCKADLSMAKHYHRRHKVCEYHSKAATVRIGEQTQRFCQQCSRFHVLDEFDDGKRSCRKRLADHNRRRRKPQPTSAATTTTTASAVAEKAAAATTTAGDVSADDQPLCKEEESQEATGSESRQTGEQSCKGSPLPAAARDQQKSISTSTPPAISSSVANQSEVSSGKNTNDTQGKPQKREQSKAAPTSSKGGNPHLMDIAASLSLGGATEIMDVKPATHMISASIIDMSVNERPFENALNANKHAVTMPWLQGSKKHHNLQGLPYDDNSRAAAASNGGDRSQYGRFEHMSSVDFEKSSTRGSWMIKDIAAAGTTADGDTNAWLLNPRYAGGSKSRSGEAGGHELLRLLGDERELLNSNKHVAMQANQGSSIGTLAFLDNSLDESGFARSDQHRMLHFANLQNSDAEHQATMSLNHGPTSSMAFDGHNHMM